jgi:hypothetical protein
METLLSFAEHGMQEALEILIGIQGLGTGNASQQVEARAREANAICVLVLERLASIGNGFRSPDESTIDLTEDEPKSSHWIEGSGAWVQNRIIKDIGVISNLSWGSGDVIEAACNVFRSGFTEDTPGPFVFPANIVVRFLLRSTLDTPRLDAILTTATALVNSHHVGGGKIDNELPALLEMVTGFIHKLGGTSTIAFLRPSARYTASVTK